MSELTLTWVSERYEVSDDERGTKTAVPHRALTSNSESSHDLWESSVCLTISIKRDNLHTIKHKRER